MQVLSRITQSVPRHARNTKYLQIKQRNDFHCIELVFDQILTNQSVESTHHRIPFHCQRPQDFQLSAFHSQRGGEGGVKNLGPLDFFGLLLWLSHPLDYKSRSPSNQDVLLLGGSVDDRRHQQLPERLPRLDQQVVRPAKETQVSII